MVDWDEFPKSTFHHQEPIESEPEPIFGQDAKVIMDKVVKRCKMATLFGRIEAAIEFSDRGMPKAYSVLLAQIETEIEELQAELKAKNVEIDRLTAELESERVAYRGSESISTERYKKIKELQAELEAKEALIAAYKRDSEKYLKMLESKNICPDCGTVNDVCDCPFG